MKKVRMSGVRVQVRGEAGVDGVKTWHWAWGGLRAAPAGVNSFGVKNGAGGGLGVESELRAIVLESGRGARCEVQGLLRLGTLSQVPELTLRPPSEGHGFGVKGCKQDASWGVSHKAEVTLGSRKTLLATPRGPLQTLSWAVGVLVLGVPVLGGRWWLWASHFLLPVLGGR